MSDSVELPKRSQHQDLHRRSNVLSPTKTSTPTPIKVAFSSPRPGEPTPGPEKVAAVSPQKTTHGPRRVFLVSSLIMIGVALCIAYVATVLRNGHTTASSQTDSGATASVGIRDSTQSVSSIPSCLLPAAPGSLVVSCSMAAYNPVVNPTPVIMTVAGSLPSCIVNLENQQTITTNASQQVTSAQTTFTFSSKETAKLYLFSSISSATGTCKDFVGFARCGALVCPWGSSLAANARTCQANLPTTYGILSLGGNVQVQTSTLTKVGIASSQDISFVQSSVQSSTQNCASLSLIAAGRILSSNSNFAGVSGVYQTSMSSSGTSFSPSTCGLTKLSSVSPLIDFTSTLQLLMNVAAPLSAFTATATTTVQYGNLNIAFNGSLSLEVVQIAASVFSRINSIQVTRQPQAGAQVYIVVHNDLGTAFTIQNIGLPTSFGSYLWNFYDSTSSITIQNVQFYGTILAPYAAVNLKNMALIGQVWASSVSAIQATVTNTPMSSSIAYTSVLCSTCAL